MFQIVIIDNMPATGYLTNMHQFLLFSTEIVMGVAVENLIVNIAHKRRSKIEAVQLKLKGAFGGRSGGVESKSSGGATCDDEVAGGGGGKWSAAKAAATSRSPPKPKGASIPKKTDVTLGGGGSDVGEGGIEMQNNPMLASSGDVRLDIPSPLQSPPRPALNHSSSSFGSSFALLRSSFLDQGCVLVTDYMDRGACVCFPACFAWVSYQFFFMYTQEITNRCGAEVDKGIF